MSESRTREDIFGDRYTEHRDNDYRKTGESREHEGIFGDKYTEHRDSDYRKTGESREREGIFGDRYTEHLDNDGNVVGESREREGFFGGKYTEHLDRDFNVVGESHKREGIFGDKYIEHSGQAPNHVLSQNEGAADTRGLWQSLQDNAFLIGAAIGTLLGLMNAFEASAETTGYLISAGVGAVAGGVFGVLLVTLLPWGIALGAVGLVLKACGVG